MGDIEEQFQLVAIEQDEQFANRWFWKQALNSVIPLISLFAQKNLQLSVIRVIAVFAVLLPVVVTSPLKSSGMYYSLSELLGLLFAALAIGFLCRLIIKNVRFIITISIALLIFTVCLLIRGERQDVFWLLIPITIFISFGAGLALIILNRNPPNPKIRT